MTDRPYMEPLCLENRAGHCPHWYDDAVTCHYCGTPGHCDHTADPTYDGRWCGICNPWLGGDSGAGVNPKDPTHD